MSDEPVNRSVYDECVAIRCHKPVSHILTFRLRPDETFPQGLLCEVGYCWDDGIWFCGAQVAMYESTFVSFEKVDESPIKT